MPFHLVCFVPVPVVFQLFDLSKSWEDSYYDNNIENDNTEDGLRQAKVEPAKVLKRCCPLILVLNAVV